ncbi:MAG: SDR family NAD(P)-dependent oxidoreductase [Rhodanobacter sp.]
MADAWNRVKHEIDSFDPLFNTADIGIGMLVRVSEESVGDMYAMFEVNTLGPIRVKQLFLSMLRRSKAARIVMMSSSLGSIAEATDMPVLIRNVGYPGSCASKSALNLPTAMTLSSEVERARF